MRQIDKLTQKHIDAAKPKAKPYTLADGGGLLLQIKPSGGRWWRFRYRFNGKENMLGMGTYPDVSLKMARDKRTAARTLLASDPPIDPSIARQAEKNAAASPETFKAIATEFLDMQTSGAAKTTERRFQLHVYPYIGKRPIAKITAAELLAVLKRIEHGGSRETAHRVRSACGRVWRYAVGSGRAENDIAASLQGQLAPVTVKGFATITDPKQIGELMRAIDGYQGLYSVSAALKLAPLVFVRPGELRAAIWDEFDLDAGLWAIPAERMKTKQEHLVPLSVQATAILDDLLPLTGPEGFVFPSIRTNARPMSENSVNGALRRLGYSKEQMTGHGFRAMASTLLHEQGYESDHIERQLAHIEENKVKGAYNKAKYLPQRTKMMQDWSDFLDVLKAGGEVIAIGSKGVS